MKSYSIKEAKKIRKYHDAIDGRNGITKKRNEIIRQKIDNGQISQKSMLAFVCVMIFKYESWIKKFVDSGVKIENIDDERISVSYKGLTIELENLFALKGADFTKQNECHSNCIKASLVCKFSDPQAKICISEVDVIDLRDKEVPWYLHSYIVSGEYVYDFVNGFKIDKTSFENIFYINKLAEVKVRDVYDDFNCGIAQQIKKGIKVPEYLIAREDLVSNLQKQ